jgi:hypothetical protein
MLSDPSLQRSFIELQMSYSQTSCGHRQPLQVFLALPFRTVITRPSHHQASHACPGSSSDEYLPTAIIIKNIPEVVKRDQFVQLMYDLRLPLPYISNYQLGMGGFTRLAHPYSSTTTQARTALEALNQFELHGRKLQAREAPYIDYASSET